MNATNESNKITELLEEIATLDTFKEEKQKELFGMFFADNLNINNYKNKED